MDAMARAAKLFVFFDKSAGLLPSNQILNQQKKNSNQKKFNKGLFDS
jgi:hypothetical protein